MAAAADVVHFTYMRRMYKFSKGFDKIEAMDVVAHLFAFISKDAVRLASDGANHEIRKKAVQLGASVGRSGQTAAAKRHRRHSEIASVLLHQNVGRRLGCSEERM